MVSKQTGQNSLPPQNQKPVIDTLDQSLLLEEGEARFGEMLKTDTQVRTGESNARLSSNV